MQFHAFLGLKLYRNLKPFRMFKLEYLYLIISILFLPFYPIPFQPSFYKLILKTHLVEIIRLQVQMIHTSKQNSAFKKLNYLLHKHVSKQENKAEQIQQDKPLNKTTILPLITPNTRYKNVSTQHQRINPILTVPHKRQNDYRQTANDQISAKDYIEVNKSILKMIEEKIYPMNKELTKKMKFKHNHLCETMRNSLQKSPDYSITGNKQSKQKNKHKSKKKLAKETQKPGDISDEKLGLTNKEKRTKSQEQIIRLQAKVESYLRDRKKLLKFKYDQEMQNIVHTSLTSSKITQSIKQQAKQRTIKRLLTVHSSKKKKSKKQKNCSNNSLFIQKESELKRIIKLFEERGNNYNWLETGKSKFKMLEQTEDKKGNLKDLTGVSSKDLSQSLKIISNIVNRKLEQVKDIQDAEIKDTGHREIIQRVKRQETSKMFQSSNQSTSKKRIFIKNKENVKQIGYDDSQFKLSQSNKNLEYQENAQKQDKKQQTDEQGVEIQKERNIQQVVQVSPTQRSVERQRTGKLLTENSNKSGKSSKLTDKQNMVPMSQETSESKFDLKSEKSYKILPSREGQALDKELLGEIQQQLLDEKKNIMKKKINEKKLMMRRKDSYILGISAL